MRFVKGTGMRVLIVLLRICANGTAAAKGFSFFLFLFFTLIFLYWNGQTTNARRRRALSIAGVAVFWCCLLSDCVR